MRGLFCHHRKMYNVLFQKLYEHGPRLPRPEKEYQRWYSINKSRKLHLLKDDKPKKRNVTLWSGPGKSHR